MKATPDVPPVLSALATTIREVAAEVRAPDPRFESASCGDPVENMREDRYARLTGVALRLESLVSVLVAGWAPRAPVAYIGPNRTGGGDECRAQAATTVALGCECREADGKPMCGRPATHWIPSALNRGASFFYCRACAGFRVGEAERLDGSGTETLERGECCGGVR